MRRPSAARSAPGVALFPFLAVLICTMGALIVLLVLVVQQARASAARPAASAEPVVDPEELKRLREEEEDLHWRAGMLQGTRDEAAQELTNKRLELAHLEDHIRRLEDQAKKLIAQVEHLKNAGKGKLADRDAAQRQLADMEQEIAEKKEELEKARREALRRRPAYAIVPYDGPNGTSRRPMYIECTEEGIILQPEGIVLTAEDFQGPQGPGNPLDAALRATREHLARNGLQSEPYPLIIVRPNGALAFGACRGAMKHWESEFGYELVDQDAELKFPPADPELAATLRRAVVDARQRQMALVAAMPNRFAAENRLASFRAADHFDPDAMPGATSGTAGGVGGRGPAQRGVPTFHNGGTGMGTGPRGATGSGGSGSGGQGGTGDRTPTGTSRSGTIAQQGRSSGGPGSGNSNTASQQEASVTSGQTSPGNSGGSSYAGGTVGGAAPSGSSTQQLPGGTSTSSSGARSGSAGSPAGSPGGASAGSGGSQSDPDRMNSASATPSLTFSPQMQKARKAIKNRGENWGLPSSAAKATAVTRPIFVECYADKLKLLPEKGDIRTPLVVPIEDDLSTNLDAVVVAVWGHMDRWGIAVLGGYWKPILTVDVKPGGEQRFAELQELLKGSGIEVERKNFQ